MTGRRITLVDRSGATDAERCKRGWVLIEETRAPDGNGWYGISVHDPERGEQFYSLGQWEWRTITKPGSTVAHRVAA